MNKLRIEIHPTGKVIYLTPGAPLKDMLFQQGVEFPCGGRGTCGKCKIKLLEGFLPPSEADKALLTPAELEQGWRLACQAYVYHPIKIELAQWTFQFFIDLSPIKITPRPGIGIAVDIGTTTVVVQALDLESGTLLCTKSALNQQAKYGHDIISRLDHAIKHGAAALTQIIRNQVGTMIKEALIEVAQRSQNKSHPVSNVVLVGNTVMHHLFCGLPVDSLAVLPFEPSDPGLKTFTARELGWTDSLPIEVRSLLPENTRVDFLPCIGGFVGSDILAGVLATNIHSKDNYNALVDLGTNGEIVIGMRGKLVCASAAAGPAFEGGGISCGMRAVTGAISGVSLQNDQIKITVIGGDISPRGICGSGLLDAIAVGLRLGIISTTGQLLVGEKWELVPGIALTKQDIREIQLAKAAIAAGFKILLRTLGIELRDLTAVHLAGAFGNYINPNSAVETGLLPGPTSKIIQAGNTALLGAKLALYTPYDELTTLAQQIQHVPLNTHPEFQDIFAEKMLLVPCTRQN